VGRGLKGISPNLPRSAAPLNSSVRRGNSGFRLCRKVICKAGFGADWRRGSTRRAGFRSPGDPGFRRGSRFRNRWFWKSGSRVSESPVASRGFRTGGTGKPALRSRPNKPFKWDADSMPYLRRNDGAPRPLILSLGSLSQASLKLQEKSPPSISPLFQILEGRAFP
jgi:hypothetical protein